MDIKYNGFCKLHKEEEPTTNYFDLSKDILEKQAQKINLDLLASFVTKSLAETFGLKHDYLKTNENYTKNQSYGFYIHPRSQSADIPGIIFTSVITLLRNEVLLPSPVDEKTPNTPLVMNVKIFSFVDNIITELKTYAYSFDYSTEKSMVTIRLTQPEAKYLAPKSQIVISKSWNENDYKEKATQAAEWILSTIKESV